MSAPARRKTLRAALGAALLASGASAAATPRASAAATARAAASATPRAATAASAASREAPGDDPAAAACPQPWPQWRRYAEAFISADGRVIERSAQDRTTSEGEAYALFFSLVADDRALFDRVLAWSAQNLAQGDLGSRLPSWNWGRRRDGTWGVVDPNPASDADLWMAYALLEAGRLWATPRYAGLGRAILASVVQRETADLEGLGPMLLPGPTGFALDGGRGFRLNPSYQPPQLLRRFASLRVPGPWSRILESAARMVRETAGRGAVADWVLYRPRQGFAPDPVHGSKGSYDAIRSYLWLGMLPPGDPALRAQGGAKISLLRDLAQTGSVPEQIDAGTLVTKGKAPVGFAGALLPLAHALGDERAAQALTAWLAREDRGGLYGDPPVYYDQNLILFGLGFTEGRFRFAPDGGLVTAWEARCAHREP